MMISGAASYFHPLIAVSASSIPPPLDPAHQPTSDFIISTDTLYYNTHGHKGGDNEEILPILQPEDKTDLLTPLVGVVVPPM